MLWGARDRIFDYNTLHNVSVVKCIAGIDFRCVVITVSAINITKVISCHFFSLFPARFLHMYACTNLSMMCSCCCCCCHHCHRDHSSIFTQTCTVAQSPVSQSEGTPGRWPTSIRWKWKSSDFHCYLMYTSGCMIWVTMHGLLHFQQPGFYVGGRLESW